MIVFAAIVPHPPFSVSGVGTSEQKKKIKKTLDSFKELRKGLEKANPDTVIIISPHGKMERYNFVINSDPILKGNLAGYGNDKVFEYKNDIGMMNQIAYACKMNEMFVHFHGYFLDHGALIPLIHLLKNIKANVVHMSFSLLTRQKHYEYGELISNILKKSKNRVAVIASGDLSHSLIPGAPAGYNPRSKFFDQRVIECLVNKDMKALFRMKNEFIKESRECGLRSILIMMGMIYQKKYNFSLMSYEGPYGIGYLTARLL